MDDRGISPSRGDRHAGGPTELIGASSTFSAAIWVFPGSRRSSTLDVPRIAATVRATLPRAERLSVDQTVMPNVRPVAVFEFGEAVSPSLERVRFFIEIPEPVRRANVGP
jgi:hypothetical protein